MGFDILALIAASHGEGAARWNADLNPQMHPMLRVVGQDRVWEGAEGAWVYDSAGKRYLDYVTGFAACGIGRNHPVVREAIHRVLDLGLADMMQLATPELPALLAARLLEHAPGLARVYFCNSGTEAVEAALKFARCAAGRPRILYCRHGFHGLTLGSLSANGDASFRDGFGELLRGTCIPFGDLDALEAELRKGGVAALIVEPVQGHGTFVAPDGYLAAAARLCHDHGALLICDEVQTGLGRTGRFFAYQYDDVVPDIVTVAKALSGGYIPVGATLARDWIFRKVYPDTSHVLVHGSTFGGSAAAMAAGLATMAVIEDEDLVANAARTGEMLRQGLTRIAGENTVIREVRGRGLMIGIEFSPPRSAAVRALLRRFGPDFPAVFAWAGMFSRGVLTAPAGAGQPVLRMTPPMTLTAAEVQAGLDAFAAVADGMHGSSMMRFGATLAARTVLPRTPGRRRLPR